MSVAAFLALAGTAALLPSTSTAAIIYADGDLLLGFRATGGQGGSTDYLVNLGSASSIVNSLAPITFSLGNIGADLSTLFGSWSTRADVLWSVSGVQKIAGNGFVNNTMFATRSDAVDGPLGTNTTTPWTRPSSFGAGAPAGKVQGLGQKYGLGTTGATAADQIESASAEHTVARDEGRNVLLFVPTMEVVDDRPVGVGEHVHDRIAHRLSGDTVGGVDLRCDIATHGQRHGDLLGHRSLEATCVYLRIDTDMLRTVALPVPVLASVSGGEEGVTGNCQGNCRKERKATQKLRTAAPPGNLGAH